MNIAWGSGCWSENPVALRSFACDVNTGYEIATVSYMPDRAISLHHLGAQLLVTQLSGRFPAWWDFVNYPEPGHSAGCRWASLSLSADFSDAPQSACAAPVPTASAVSWWVYRPEWIRVKIGPYVPRAELQARTEYYAFHVVIDHAGTIGPDSCAGCSVPVCITMNGLWLYESTSSVDTPFFGRLANESIVWNGLSAPCVPPTPTQNRTWGAIKSLYRWPAPW